MLCVFEIALSVFRPAGNYYLSHTKIVADKAEVRKRLRCKQTVRAVVIET